MPGDAAVLSVQQAADVLHKQLRQSNKQLSKADIVQLLCAAGSAEPVPHKFDPALVAGLKDVLVTGTSFTLAQDGAPLWFAAAMGQLQLYEQAQDSPDLAAIMAASGALEEEYLRCACVHKLPRSACLQENGCM
jgi:hypothetical protein